MSTPSPPKRLFLTQDAVTVPGQRYALLSIVGPDQPQKTDKWGIKIRGCFATREEGEAHVKTIMEDDPHFDVFLVDMYHWLLFPPDREQIADVHYQEQFLEDLIRGHHDNAKKARRMFEERKEKVMVEGLDKHLLPDERIPRPPELIGDAPATPSESMGVMTQDPVPTSSGPSTSSA
jgi:hypothetical protein